MFEGSKEISLDEKGRLAMPANFKRTLQSESGGLMTITMDPGKACLRCYPRPVWERVRAKISQLPEFDAAADFLKDMMIGHAESVDMDKQGRALVPQSLRSRLELDGKVMLMGKGGYFEMWSPSAYEERIESARAAMTSGALANSPSLQGLTLQ